MMDPVVILQVLLQGLMVGAMYSLISLAMTLIFLTTELMNFAHGSFLLLAMYLCLSLGTALSLDPYISLFITVPLLFAIGLLLFRLVISRVLKGNILVAAQITLGLLWIIEAGLSLKYGFNTVSVQSVLSSNRIHIGSIVIGTPYVVSFAAAVAVGIALYWLIQKTHFGRSVRALTQNRDAAQLMGVRVVRVQTAVFGLGLALLGFAGPLIAPMTVMTPLSGLNFTLFSFSIMIFGGMGNLLGAVVGGLIFGVVQAFAQFYTSGNYSAIIPYAVLILVILLRPQGVLGGK